MNPIGDARNGSPRWLAAILVTLALLSATSCASDPSRDQDYDSAQSISDAMRFGPRRMPKPARVVWVGTIGIVTIPLWLPALAYERISGDTRPSLPAVRDPIADRVEATASAPVQSSDGDLDAIKFGGYHAVVFGNDAYESLQRLRTAGSDARAVGELLRRDYGFSVTVHINATRRDMLSALHGMRDVLAPTDNLLVYYAGHGYLDSETNEGYWLPVDAALDEPSNWLSNATITTMLRGLHAKHVLVVADSCFSGSLTRSFGYRKHPPSYIHRLAGKRARVVLTSGGLEPVADQGGGGHSVFAKFFLRALKENRLPVLEGSRLFLGIRQPVLENAVQTPEYGPIRLAGHEGGDFLFVRPRPGPTH